MIIPGNGILLRIDLSEYQVAQSASNTIFEINRENTMGNKEKKYLKLYEGTARDSLKNQKGAKKTALWVKNTQLDYEIELHKLQIELLKLQCSMIKKGEKALAIFEGRDAAGKGGTILRLTQHLNPRNVKIVALPKPSDRELSQWYFQRYINHLPAAGEFVVFDRSWYNRAMVEPVMGFCTEEQHSRFLKDVPSLEEMLVQSGIKLFKFYFSVSREEQKARFESRRKDPLKHYKISPVDEKAQKMWDQYSVRKFQMLTATQRENTPWTIIRSDHKKNARINCIKHILSSFDYEGKISEKDLTTDPKIVIPGEIELRLMEENMATPEKLPG